MSANFVDKNTDGQVSVQSVVHPSEGRLMELVFKWTIDKWRTRRLRRRGPDLAHGAACPMFDHYFKMKSGSVYDVVTGINGDGRWNFGVEGRDDERRGSVKSLGIWLEYSGLNRPDIVAGSKFRVSVDYGPPAAVLASKECVLRPAGAGFANYTEIPVEFWSARTIIIEVVATVKDCAYSQMFKRTQELRSDPRKKFQEYYEAEMMTDFKLVSSDEKELKCHRIYLAANSEMFQAMFEHDTKEKRTGICEITDVDYETLKVLVDSFYGLNIDERMAAIPEKILIAADKYQLLELKNKCVKSLKSSLAVENAVDLFALSRVGGADELAENVIKFVRDNYDQFVEHGGILEMATKVPEAHKEFFKKLGAMQQDGIKKTNRKRSASEAGFVVVD